MIVAKLLTMMDTLMDIAILPAQQAKFRNDLYEEARQTKITLSSARESDIFRKFDVVELGTDDYKKNARRLAAIKLFS
jgi:hypothetical protein